MTSQLYKYAKLYSREGREFVNSEFVNEEGQSKEWQDKNERILCDENKP